MRVAYITFVSEAEEIRERFYSPRELRGSRVYDSEGLYHGEVGGVEFGDDGVYVEVVVRRRVGEPLVDVGALRARLLAAGHAPPPGATLEEMVALAREFGVEVPKRPAERELVLAKSRVPVGEIAWIDEKVLSTPEVKGLLRVILLRSPREAKYRGVRGSGKPAAPTPGLVEGKPVLSLSRGFLGIAGGVTVGFGVPGVRVFLKRGGEREIMWLSYLRALRKAGLLKLAERLYEVADPYMQPRLPGERLGEVREMLGRLEAPRLAYSLLEDHVETAESKDVYVDVSWARVLKVGDAVVCR